MGSVRWVGRSLGIICFFGIAWIEVEYVFFICACVCVCVFLFRS